MYKYLLPIFSFCAHFCYNCLLIPCSTVVIILGVDFMSHEIKQDLKQDLNDFVILAAFLLWPIVLFAYVNIMEHYEAKSENSDDITISESNNNQSQSLKSPER